ncbi:hypothetical protein [Halomonas sp.]|uniref:hypothetical protein n=1 Tax=Halomonas sp. TaxID=1486246 RepID=UPI00298D9A15|nr:hypothetical protein [Halomonas sp.]MDW7745661.1 hypothetical protein [Halomonas sp.]
MIGDALKIDFSYDRRLIELFLAEVKARLVLLEYRQWHILGSAYVEVHTHDRGMGSPCARSSPATSAHLCAMAAATKASVSRSPPCAGEVSTATALTRIAPPVAPCALGAQRRRCPGRLQGTHRADVDREVEVSLGADHQMD